MANDDLADQAVIRLDDRTREKLDVKTATIYQFGIREVWWLGQFLWAWNASDPTARVAARLGILGFALGVIGAVLGIWGLLK